MQLFVINSDKVI